MKPKEINSVKRLVNYLNISEAAFDEIMDSDYIEINNIEDEFSIPEQLRIRKISIPKRSGGRRLVYSCVSDVLSNTLKILNTKLSTLYQTPRAVHGFVKGKNIRTNANAHLTKKYVLVVDIENYFDTITTKHIEQSLQNLGFPESASQQLAKLTTYKSSLVQGFNTSPTLANIVFLPLDKKLGKIDKNITYTRYADDLYFSSDDEFEIEDEVQNIIASFGFKINTSKTKMMKRGWHQYVTGLTIFDNQTARISKKVKRKLRQQIYYINKFGYRSYVLYELNKTSQDYFNTPDLKDKVDVMIYQLEFKLNGWLLFINSIEPIFAKRQSELLKLRFIEP